MLMCVRTTIRLPDDLYTRVRVSAAADGGSVTSFIEEALRAALARREHRAAVEPYRVAPWGEGGVAPGVDLDDTAALLDVMDGDARP